MEQANHLYDQRMTNEAAAGMGNIFVIFAGGQIKPLSLDKLTENLNPAQLV